MLHDLVTQALSQLFGQDRGGQPAGRFRYAYASDDGRYVAILTHELVTYVVDVPQKRYFAERAGLPCGFAGHVLEMEDAPRRQRTLPANDIFDLDLEAEDIDWRVCPGARAA
ncbi:hypothetical protein [Bordetella sp. 2513F-2]